MAYKGFKTKTKDMAFPLGAAIQREQENRRMNNEELAFRVGLSVRTIDRVKNGGSANLSTMEKILFELGLELTAQPIGGNYNGKY